MKMLLHCHEVHLEVVINGEFFFFFRFYGGYLALVVLARDTIAPIRIELREVLRVLVGDLQGIALRG